MSLMITTSTSTYIVSNIKSNDYFPVDPNDPLVMSYYHQNSRFIGSSASVDSVSLSLFWNVCIYNVSKANNAEIYDICAQAK
jgi:hypothetical protein